MIPGGPVAEDDLVMVSHSTPAVHGRTNNPVYLGHLFVEPLRHAPGLADLSDAEAERVGWWCTRASRALREVAGAQHVYAEVIGDAVPHLHVHLTARYPDAPREYWWPRVKQWPQAPRGGLPEIEALVRALRAFLTGAGRRR